MTINLSKILSSLALFIFVLSHPVWADISILTQEPDVPYQKIASIQVSQKSGFWGIGSSNIQSRLNRKLLTSAKKYRADALTEVKYYPETGKPSYFRRREYFAQATLIQYLKFPEPPSAPQNAPAANY